MAEVLSGSGILTEDPSTKLFLAIWLMQTCSSPFQNFKSEIDGLIKAVKNAPKIIGVEAIVISDEPEFKTR